MEDAVLGGDGQGARGGAVTSVAVTGGIAVTTYHVDLGHHVAQITKNVRRVRTEREILHLTLDPVPAVSDLALALVRQVQAAAVGPPRRGVLRP